MLIIHFSYLRLQKKTTPTTPNIFFSEEVLLKRKYVIIWKKKYNTNFVKLK